jgi:topoisomerase-4 subunit A
MTDTSLIADKPFAAALSERYLAYALSTITARSLPDVRDGLKPVHRRILYAMRLRLVSNEPPRKSARVVGDVMGKYHPHGDQSIYDALVRLAQDFNSRYPLVDGQGNFGNIDGDNAAAMRYTEARLTAISELLLDGLTEDAVDFRLTYDESEGKSRSSCPPLSPTCSPMDQAALRSAWPQHPAAQRRRTMRAALRYLITTPNAGIEKLVGFVQGPDFPTGGMLVEPRAKDPQCLQNRAGRFPRPRQMGG